MRVTGHATIKGRGVVTLIDALSAWLAVGHDVTGGNPSRVWSVCGIETLAMPRSHTNGKPAGLLLQGHEDPPAVDDVLVG